HVEALEIDVASIHDVEGAGLGNNFVQDIDVVSLAISDPDECGDVAAEVEQGVHFDGGFVLSKFRPRKQRQAQIDGSGVQRIEALVEIHADRIGRAERSRDANQYVREVSEDAPVARLVGVRHRGTRHLALETHVVQLRAQCTETCFDITQTLSVSKLRKRHGQILIPAREAAEAGGAIVTSYATTKFPIRQEGDQL